MIRHYSSHYRGPHGNWSFVQKKEAEDWSHFAESNYRLLYGILSENVCKAKNDCVFISELFKLCLATLY